MPLNVGKAMSALALGSGLLANAPPSFAFPPYRSTDADTADPDTLELRVGVIAAFDGKTQFTAPALRVNYGLPGKIELTSELEYAPQDGAFGDGATGFKWVPVFGDTLSFGIETLALLPIRPGDSGAGWESQLLASYRKESLRLHMNVGAFQDTRAIAAENGWRASMLVEFPRPGWRPGLELFAKQVDGKPVAISAGIGGIFHLGIYEIRTGLHVGLSKQAPDLRLNLWISSAFPF
ncbi:MAG TPA: hypothetical protein VJ800_06925 [Pseudolabrys sp.]|nr:hypothetical protein [Pseudolabrys sp.]